MGRALNPDRISKAKIPRGWRLIREDELTAETKRDARVWEPEIKGFGEIISVRYLMRKFTNIVPKS